MANHRNFAQTTLGAAITDTSGTSITVTSETSFPSAPFIISIDTECLLVTNVATTTWTVTRGYEGSTAATHLNGAAIYHDFSAGEADSTVHGPASATDGHLAVFDATTGKLIKDGPALVTTVGATGDDTSVPTEQAVREAIAGSKRLMGWKVFDDATAVTVGDGKVIFSIPPELNGMNLVSVFASVSTVSSSGTPEVTIYNLTDSADMLSTSLTIDATEYDSSTATAAVIDTTHDDVATGDRLEINVDTAGTGAKGLFVVLGFSA